MGRTPRACVDASDFAFDLLYESNPDALEIADVRPEDD